MINSSIRRVVGLSELFSFAGTWLTRRGKRFTSLATVITLGAFLADILGNNIFGYQMPVNKLEMATAPILAGSVTFGLGGALRYAAKLLSGADRAAAEANSVREVREIKQTPQATRKQAEDLWDRVGQYESVLFNGKDANEQDEIEYLAKCRSELFKAINGLRDGCLVRHGVDLSKRREGIDNLIRHIEVANPFSSGIELSRKGFVESVVYALNEAMPQMEQENRIGFDVSQVESYRNWEIFESRLSKKHAANRFLKAAVKKCKVPVRVISKYTVKGFYNDVLCNLTRNKLYMMAGKGMNGLNLRIGGHSFDAQPFLWLSEVLEEQIGEIYGGEVLEILLRDRSNIKKQIFWDRTFLRRHVYDCFDADYLRALRLRLGFDVEYAAGMLRQKPKEDLAKMRELVGVEILSDHDMSEYQKMARKSLEESSKYLEGLDELAGRAVRIAYYTRRKVKGGFEFDYEDAGLVREFTDEIVQVRIYEYLAREQVRMHCELIERLDRVREEEPVEKTLVKINV